jgi:hypothetical protein
VVASGGDLVPISDAQAELFKEAVKALEGLGAFLKEILGTVPHDIVGLLGGDWLRVRRAENLARIIEKSKERLRARGVEPTEPASLSIVLPILVAAADESRDELQDIWAGLLAAAADPERAMFFRNQFIEVVKKMDPLDAALLQQLKKTQRDRVSDEQIKQLAGELKVSTDEIAVSLGNLTKLGLLIEQGTLFKAIGSFARAFLKTISD